MSSRREFVIHEITSTNWTFFLSALSLIIIGLLRTVVYFSLMINKEAICLYVMAQGPEDVCELIFAYSNVAFSSRAGNSHKIILQRALIPYGTG